MSDTRNFKYISKWTGKHTKWDYKLEIILPPVGYPAGLALSSPTEIELPIGSVRLKGMKINYKDYSIALPEVPTMNFDVDFDLLNESNYTALVNAFFEESPILTITSDLPNKILGVAAISSGIIFNLYIKFNGCDTNDPIPYRLVRTGIYQSDGKIKLDAKNKVISFDAIDINRVCTSPFPWRILEMYTPADAQASKQLNEFIWINNEDQNYFKVLTNVVNSSKEVVSWYEAITFEELETIIKNTSTAIKKTLMRDNSQALDLTMRIPHLYKQLSDGSGNKGDEILRSEVRILSHIYHPIDGTQTFVDGLFFADDKNSLNGRYPNGAWDFINEMSEFSLIQSRVGPIGITSGFYNFSNITIDLTKVKVNNIEIKSEQYKTVTSSCYEVKSDENTGGDIEKWEETTAGGKNEASWTIPIVFNNTPPAVKFGQPSSIKWVKESEPSKPRKLNFYYWNGSSLERVHEWAKFNLNYDETNNKSSDDFNTFAPVSRSANNNLAFRKPHAVALGCQTTSGIPMILAKTLKKLLENGLDKVEIEVPIDEYVSFIAGGGGNGFIWNFPEYYEATFHLNIASIFNITYTKDKWKMITSDIDTLNETAKVTLINLNV